MVRRIAHLRPSTRDTKKWMVTIVHPDGRRKTVHFGERDYEDYTMHKDPERMRRYVARHDNGRESWTMRGVDTAGFWSRWLLWSKPSLTGAIRFMQSKFPLTIKRSNKGSNKETF